MTKHCPGEIFCNITERAVSDHLGEVERSPIIDEIYCSPYTFLSINGIELTASEVDAASFFLELAASLEKQEESMEKLISWLQDNSESIED